MPNEVLELILKNLPTLSLFRFRAVCKHWNNIISSQRLFAGKSLPPFQEHWICMISEGGHSGNLFAYNPQQDKWHTLSLPIDTHNHFPYGVAADGNLVCLSDRCFTKSGTYGRVIVCDPLLKVWQELPPLRSWGVIRGMVVDPTSKAFKILATNFVEGDNVYEYTLTCAELYDSNSEQWQIIEPPEIIFIAADCCSVFSNSRFCFLDKEDNLFAYDVEQEVWMRVPTSSLPYSSSRECKRLLESDGRIFLLTVENDDYGRDFTFWRLNGMMTWERAARPPQRISTEFFKNCKDDGGLLKVWAVTVGGTSFFMRNSLLNLLLHLDLSKEGDEQWRWIPLHTHVHLTAKPHLFCI